MAIGFVSAGILLLGGAALSYWRDRPDPQMLCIRAADRWGECIRAKPGSEFQAGLQVVVAMSMSQGEREEGIAACAGDAMTVSMYEPCLPASDCTKFMRCLEDFVKE